MHFVALLTVQDLERAPATSSLSVNTVYCKFPNQSQVPVIHQYQHSIVDKRATNLILENRETEKKIGYPQKYDPFWVIIRHGLLQR